MYYFEEILPSVREGKKFSHKIYTSNPIGADDPNIRPLLAYIQKQSVTFNGKSFEVFVIYHSNGQVATWNLSGLNVEQQFAEEWILVD